MGKRLRQLRESPKPIVVPSCVTPEMLAFIDKRRDENVAKNGNASEILGLAPEIRDRFKISLDQARDILVYWFRTYLNRRGDRIAEYDPYWQDK